MACLLVSPYVLLYTQIVFEFDSSKKNPSSSTPMLLPAYFVQEKHHFVETVQLKGLQYDPVLQEENSGFSIVLTSVLKSQVSSYSSYFYAHNVQLQMFHDSHYHFLTDKKCLCWLINFPTLP